MNLLLMKPQLMTLNKNRVIITIVWWPSPKRVVKDDSPLPTQYEHEAQLKSPLNDEDSLVETLKVVKQSIKLSKQHKVDWLKDIE